VRYHPTSDDSLEELLRIIGLPDVEALFRSIPDEARMQGQLEVPGPLSEMELERRLEEMAARNRPAGQGPSFLGAGAYDHYSPAVVDHLLLRGEFLTAYTPYQAEISQGTLQAIFEFQTLIAQLTEMDVANASLYDGATALAEGVFMAQRLKRRGRILLSAGIHPHYREVVHSLGQHSGIRFEEVGLGPDGRTDAARLEQAMGDDVAAVAIQSPNFFGCIEDLPSIEGVAHGSGGLFVVNVVEPISLGLLAGPGRFGADIVVGEGQPFGLPLSYGGPYLGLMATRDRFLRQMPGRLAGEASDAEGRRGYTLTLSTREQHIRRERATSNICTKACARWQGATWTWPHTPASACRSWTVSRFRSPHRRSTSSWSGFRGTQGTTTAGCPHRGYSVGSRWGGRTLTCAIASCCASRR
jgi:glycine dehydrogenase subunit 1